MGKKALSKPKVEITIGKHSGFCFGVKRAYDLTCVNSKNPASPAGRCTDIYILGKLVHNNDVCEDLRKRGIKELKSIDSIKDGTVIFTAHGVGPCLYEKASNRGLKIIDTTCPKVMKAQRLAKTYTEKKIQVLIFGDKNHKEVKSIREWTKNKARIVSNFDELKKMKLNKKKKYCLISQTTQNAQEFKKITAFLKKNFKNFIFFNTICPSTDDRQTEIRKLAKRNGVVIVIGGQDSANSRRLFEISKKINKNSYFIENEKNLGKISLKNAKNIAISAGASTPDWVIKKTVDNLKKRIKNSLDTSEKTE